MVITTAKIMREKKTYHMNLRRIARHSVLFLSFHPFTIYAADWKITPTLNVRETYSDNAGFSSSGGDNGDFITEINPGISVSGTGARLKLNASYTMQNIFYANGTNDNRISNQLNASANAELLKEHFFLDGSASVSQQNISPFGAQATNNINFNSNRTDVISYSISPYFRQRFGSFASAEARYSHSSTSAGADGFSDSQSDSANISLNSGSMFGNLGWGLNLSHQHYNNNNLKPVDTDTFTGNISYALTPRFRLNGTGGYEQNNYVSVTGKNPLGPFWTVGFSWNPSQRTSISANYGKRFLVILTLHQPHRTRRTAWSLGYSENVTNSSNQFQVPVTIDTAKFLNELWKSSIPDDALRQQFVDAFIRNTGLSGSLATPVNYLTNQFFLQKSLQASVSFSAAKNTFVLCVFDTSREAQTGQASNSVLLGNNNSSLLDNTEQVGINGTWSYRISPRANANVSAGYSQSTSRSENVKSDNTTFRASLNKQFRPRMSGTLEVRHNEQSSNRSDSGFGGYGENAVSASLNMTF